MSWALQPGMMTLGCERQPALHDASRGKRSPRRRPTKRTLARLCQVFWQVDNKNFRDARAVGRQNLALEGQRIGMCRPAAGVAPFTDPGFLASFADLVAARLGPRHGASHQNTEVTPMMVALMGSINGDGTRNADTDISLIHVGVRLSGRLLGKKVVVIRETDPTTARPKNMQVRASAERSGGEWFDQVACVYVDRWRRTPKIHPNTFSMAGAVTPVAGGI